MSPTITVCQLLLGLRVGGAEVLAARLARQLRDRYRFVFACLDEMGSLGEELRGEGFTVEVLRRLPGVDWGCMRRLADVLRGQRVDLVHAHQYTPFFYGATARAIRRRPAVLLTEHGRTFPDYPRPKRMFANRLLLRRSDRVVGVGQAVRRALIANEGFPEARVGVIYNGIPLAAFTTNDHDHAAIRREIGIGGDDLAMMQVARLDPLKDHAAAIRALERVVARRPDARLILVGEGPEEGPIRTLVRERRLESHVRFLGLRSDVPRLLAAADIGLLTSVSEGIPLALIETMAARKPVVSTDVGGVREVVEDGLTALLAPAGDEEALAESILRLAADPKLRDRLGQRGHDRALRLFSEETMHDGYRQLYEEMLGRR